MGDRKIQVRPEALWRHHRSGWREAAHALSPLHHPRGIAFAQFLEAVPQPLRSPFVGVLHHTPRHPDHLHRWDLQAKYRRLPDLENYFQRPQWKDSESFCRGLFTLSRYTADFVRSQTQVPVQALFHPRAPVPRPFRWRGRPGRLLFIGSWMRDFRPFFSLKAPQFQKQFVVPFPWVGQEIGRLGLDSNGIPIRIRLAGWRYDQLLRHSVVFLRLFDAAAVNTVLDCLFFHTPLVVNRLPALEEYLGPNYPLFFDDLTQAEELLADTDRLREGHTYLAGRDKTPFSLTDFGGQIQRTPFYQQLPEPEGAA